MEIKDLEPGDIVITTDGEKYEVEELRNGWAISAPTTGGHQRRGLRAKHITSFTRPDRNGICVFKRAPMPMVPPSGWKRREKLKSELTRVMKSPEYRKGLNHAIETAVSIRAALSDRRPGEGFPF